MNMQKTCASCLKVVYPLEQFTCLDQVWHKRCFRCYHCGMALNMTSYRGYEKKPYCVAHYPQPKRFTVVQDTPELQRVAKTTRVLSNANYYQRFCQVGGLDAQHRPNISAYQRTASAAPVLLGSYDNHLVQYDNSKTTANIRFDNVLHSTEYLRHPTPTNGQPTLSDPAPCLQATATGGQEVDDRFTGSVAEPQYVQTQQINCANPYYTEVTAPVDRSINQDLKYRAMFDFQAREEDEVSFIEGDIIVNTDPITDGWMYGTVQRTGQYGMLPSNYLELIAN